MRILFLCSFAFKADFKSLYIARSTTCAEVVRLVLAGYDTQEKPENFCLREGSANHESKSSFISKGTSLIALVTIEAAFSTHFHMKIMVFRFDLIIAQGL